MPVAVHVLERRSVPALFLVVLAALAQACDGEQGDDVTVRSPTPGVESLTSVPEDVDSIAVRIGGAVIDAEIARTPEQRVQGLSDRPSLDGDAGMLFVFEEERQPTFTMRRMHFPLDFIWISGDLRVADLHENVPNPTDREPDVADIQPARDALYVLEINAGIVAEFGVQVGEAVVFLPPAREPSP